MNAHLIGKLDEIIEDLIWLKFRLLDSRPAPDGENASTVPQNAPQGKFEYAPGQSFQDAIDDAIYQTYNSANLESQVKGE